MPAPRRKGLSAQEPTGPSSSPAPGSSAGVSTLTKLALPSSAPCPRLRGLCRERLEVLRERQSGARLDRYRRRFDTCLCRILGSDQKLRVDAAAPSRLALLSRLGRRETASPLAPLQR